MKVTKINVYSLSEENKRPVSGDVTFSDGVTYSWSNYTDFLFHMSRDYGFCRKRYSFKSKKRADISIKALDNGEWEHVVLLV